MAERSGGVYANAVLETRERAAPLATRSTPAAVPATNSSARAALSRAGSRPPPLGLLASRAALSALPPHSRARRVRSVLLSGARRHHHPPGPRAEARSPGLGLARSGRARNLGTASAARVLHDRARADAPAAGAQPRSARRAAVRPLGAGALADADRHDAELPQAAARHARAAALLGAGWRIVRGGAARDRGARGGRAPVSHAIRARAEGAAGQRDQGGNRGDRFRGRGVRRGCAADGRSAARRRESVRAAAQTAGGRPIVNAAQPATKHVRVAAAVVWRG